MTVVFDDRARKRLINRVNENDFKYTGWKVRDIEVKEIDTSIAREYISTFHYSKTFPDSTRFCYGAFIKNQIIGVICYGMGCGKNQYLAVIPDIQNGQYIELTRVWCMNEAPRNTESKFISETLKMLPKDIILVLSFSDNAQGHCGLIYQATNWYYLGVNKGGKMLLLPNGIQKHPRLLGIYRDRHPEYSHMNNKELMELLGYEYCEGGSKHRYVYLRGGGSLKRKMYMQITNRILPYPKSNTKTDLIDEWQIINNEKEKEESMQMTIFDFIEV